MLNSNESSLEVLELIDAYSNTKCINTDTEFTKTFDMFSKLTIIEKTIYEEIVEKNNSTSIYFQLMMDKGYYLKDKYFTRLRDDRWLNNELINSYLNSLRNNKMKQYTHYVKLILF